MSVENRKIWFLFLFFSCRFFGPFGMILLVFHSSFWTIWHEMLNFFSKQKIVNLSLGIYALFDKRQKKCFTRGVGGCPA